MAMNLARTGVSAVVGVTSAVLQEKVDPLVFGDTKVSWGTIAEAVAVLGGGAMQLFAPYTAPSIMDGLVDGGIALLAARGTRFALAQTAAAPYARSAVGQPMRVGALDGGRPMAEYRAQIGNISGITQSRLY